MKKKEIWTIELPSNVTHLVHLYSAIDKVGGNIVDVKEKILPLTDEECCFWRQRWENLPSTDSYFFPLSGRVYTIRECEKNLKVGVAKCDKEDTFNHLFGRALADARCLGDRKLERALLRFTPEQLEKYF